MALAKEETTLEPTDNLAPEAAPEARADFERIVASSTCEQAQAPVVHGPASAHELSGDELRRLFARNFERLRGVTRKYVSQKGLALGAEVDDVALEIVSETFEQAHRSLHRFDRARAPSGDPLAWLYGIASTLVNGRVRARAKSPETSLSALRDASYSGCSEEARGDEELFDRLALLAGQGRSREVSERLEAEASLAAMLALVSPEDALVLRLAFEEDMDGAAMAQRLGISHAAARQRLSRALARLKRRLENR